MRKKSILQSEIIHNCNCKHTEKTFRKDMKFCLVHEVNFISIAIYDKCSSTTFSRWLEVEYNEQN